MAERRFGDSQRSPRSREAASVNYLHEVEEVIQVEHEALRRPIDWTLSSIFGDFLAERPAPSFWPLSPDRPRPRMLRWGGPDSEVSMERRHFLHVAALGGPDGDGRPPFIA